MPEEILFETESRISRTEIADYLRSVADRLETGTVTLSAGDNSVTVEIPERPTFETKIERETPSSGGNGELSLELELEWPEDGGNDGTLSVE